MRIAVRLILAVLLPAFLAIEVIMGTVAYHDGIYTDGVSNYHWDAVRIVCGQLVPIIFGALVILALGISGFLSWFFDSEGKR
jgi:hypothetical protein